MILGGLEIKKRMETGDIAITPFDEKYLGPNSYDIHLSDELLRYDTKGIIDPEDLPKMVAVDKFSRRSIGLPVDDRSMDEPRYWILNPGILYLGHTVEYTETKNLVPMIEGRSSIGRLGIFIHATAGFGDVGFKGNWTLEISVVQSVVLEVGTRIGQLFYHTICGDFVNYSGRYLGDRKASPSKLKRK